MPNVKKTIKVENNIFVAKSSKNTVLSETNDKPSPPVVIHYIPRIRPRTFYERRYLTLCSCSTRTIKNGWREYPACNVQGKWMSDAGFNPGQTVEVKVYHKKLIISVIREREENFPD